MERVSVGDESLSDDSSQKLICWKPRQVKWPQRYWNKK